MFAEARAETFDGIDADRLCPVGRHAPARQIEAGKAFISDPVDAQLVGEVGSGGQRAAIAVNRPQPAFRTRQKAQRWHHHQLDGVIQAAQPCTDQPHVVVERQPADEHISGDHPHTGAISTYVRQQIRVRQDNALGIAGAARGVLQKADVRSRGMSAFYFAVS